MPPQPLTTPDPAHFFLPVDGGQRLCVYHAPAGQALATLVHVPAFGDEMNKSRRMVALQAHALAQAGCAVLLIDLLGCGDSSGDHGDATWQAWLEDVQAACRWLAQRHGDAPAWLWGLRSGALLAAQAAAARAATGHAVHQLLWQPMPAGKTLVQQLLRLRAAAHLGDAAASKAAMAALRQDLAEGRSVDVAGYRLAAALVQALEAAALTAPHPGTCVRWLDVSTRADTGLSPATSKLVTAWQADGVDVQAQVVQGPGFWQSTEIETAPLLLQATVNAVLAATRVVA